MKTMMALLLLTFALAFALPGCVEEKRTERVYIGDLESTEEGSEPIYEKTTED